MNYFLNTIHHIAQMLILS